MESELQTFRRKKQLEQTKEEIKSKFKETANSWTQSFCQALLPNWNDKDDEEDEDSINANGEATRNSHSPRDHPVNPSRKWLMYLVKFLRFLTWLLVYAGFLKIGFGAVFFCLSLLIFIYLNTRSRKRRKGEVSAYSVFNKDCQSIDGTLKAEHLEKQLLYRS